MKNKNKAVWIGVEDLNNPQFEEATKQEFVELPIVDQLSEEGAVNVETNRRDFLKYLGFGLGAATLAAGCDIPVKRAIPYVVKPDTIVPGVATYYASTYVNGGDWCPVLVKTREGRPIKIEGNTLSSITGGGTDARAQASVLSLYDTNRIAGPAAIVDGEIQKPSRRGEAGMSWDDLNKQIAGKLVPGAQIRIVANTILSPTTKKVLADFAAKHPGTKVVSYDPVSASAMLEANEESFGDAVVPNYHFDKAELIVSFDADFLGTWISPVEFSHAYAKNRRVFDAKNPKMSRHVQIESHMSLTGSNADNRIMVKPSEQGAAILALYNEVSGSNLSGPKLNASAAGKIKKLAQQLVAAKGKSLVVSGSNNKGEQVLINAINNELQNYGETISFDHASLQRQGLDKGIQDLIKEMNSGSVDVVFVMDGANPAFDLPNSNEFVEGMAKVDMKVTCSAIMNETAAICDFAAPTNHYLESWGDASPKRGYYSVIQPTIAPLFDTRQTEEVLLRLTNGIAPEETYYDYLKAHWEEAIFPMQSKFATFQNFWDSTLHDGVLMVEGTASSELPADDYAVGGATEVPSGSGFSANVASAASKVRKPSNAELEISFYETVNMGSGQYANNPWLMEMPDPVNRCSWGNYLAIPVKWEGGNDFTSFQDLNPRELYGEADIVSLTIGGAGQNVTAIRQFGQLEGTLALALGYGRSVTGYPGSALGNSVGIDVYKWMSIDEYGNTQYYATVDAVEKVGREDEFACVQYHHTMGVTGTDANGEEINVDEKTVMTLGEGYQGGLTDRSVIYQANVSEIEELLHKMEEKAETAKHLNDKTLYPYEEYKENFYDQGHHWGMYLDLNACTGCGACQVACIAENNVPVVGKKEVARHHEMTWLRIDRYYYGDYENPNVVYQPMMCQHCDNAPCENVCPVAATNHSSEGLNQMTYNRCIGTRYCANNCPYKVRRFNWLDYTTADIFPGNQVTVNGEDVPYGADNLTRMVLNPDVTVRSRGVIEKCSFCVQRIQEGKLTAKMEGRQLRDGDVKTACQTACPTGGLIFGDLNNKESDLVKAIENDPFRYKALDEINVQSSVTYSAKINNRSEELDA